MTRESVWLETAKAIRDGHVRLDHAGDHVDRRPLRREHEVDADGARLLGEADDRVLDGLRRHHHQVGELVDHDEQVRQRLLAARLEGPVRLGQVAGADDREALVAALHLGDDVLQHRRRLLRIRDDRRQEMRDRLVVVELDPLRVDQDHPHLVRRRAQQDRREQGVDAARLARAGRAGDQEVRHAREVGPDGVARDVLAEPHRERARLAGHVAEDVAERDEFAARGSVPRRRRPACRGSARGCGSPSSRARTRGRPSAPRPSRPSSRARAGARSARPAGPAI